MTSLSSTYLIPAVLLNPVIILHGFNTFCSHFVSTTLPVSTSNHQWLENLGPAAATGPYVDVHSSDQLCWSYTLIMVLLQVLAYGKVNDTRVRKKSARAAAKAERERKASQKVDKTASEAYPLGTMNGHVSECDTVKDTSSQPYAKNATNGRLSLTHNDCAAPFTKEDIQHIEDSTTEPSSEEETIV
jgi:hypothetical protein